MTREIFASEMQRLADGFSHKLTPPRINALWRKYRHFGESVIRDAVDEMLTGSRYPSGGEMEKAMDEASGREHKRSAAAHHEATQMYLGPRCAPERAKFYTRLAAWFYAQPSWPTFAEFEGWITTADLGDRPGDWMHYATAVWAQNPPGTLPGPLATAAGKAFKNTETPFRADEAWFNSHPEALKG